MKKKIVLIGGGGHAKACIDVIEQEGSFEIVGLLDQVEKVGQKVLNYEVIGTDDNIVDWVKEHCWFIVAVGQIKSAAPRECIYGKLTAAHALIATIISPLAYVSSYAKIGIGTCIMHGAKVNASAVVGDNCIINTNANIEHDVIVGNHSHVSTNAVLNGNCKIKDRVFIGSGAIVKQGVMVADNVVVGAGALVSKSINEQGTYIGNPLKRII